MAAIFQVVLAEFDIDKGSCVRAKYPRVDLPCHVPTSPQSSPPRGALALSDSMNASSEVSVWEHYLADQMLPDGAEKYPVSKTIFVVNRSRPIPKRRIPVFVFTRGSTADGCSGESSSTWIRRRSMMLPQGFTPEVITLDMVNGSLQLEDEFGDVCPQEAHSRQQCTLHAASHLPDEVSLFAKKFVRFSAGDDWEGVMAQDAVANPSPPLVVESSEESRLASSPPTQTSLPVVKAHNDAASTSSTPFVFAMFKPEGAAGSTGVLIREADFKILSPHTSSTRSPSKADDALRTPPGVALASTQGSLSADMTPSSFTLGAEDSLFHSDTMPFVPNVEGLMRCGETSPPMFGVCAAVTKKDATVRRGGINKSVALIGNHLEQLLPFFALAAEAAERCCEVKSDDSGQREELHEKILKSVFDCVSAVLSDVLSAASGMSPLDRMIVAVGAGERRSKQSALTKVVAPLVLRHSIVIPFFPSPLVDVVCSRCSLTHLLETFKERLLFLIAAMLGQQRIVMLSKAHSSTVVCESVLSLGLLGAAVDPLFLSQRVFPYSSINFMTTFRDVPGFIVGTLNPMYESQTKWWDVLVDLDSQMITCSTPEVQEIVEGSGKVPPPHAKLDEAVFREVSRGVVHRRALMVSEEGIETYVRDVLADYVKTLFAYSQPTFAANRRGLPARFVSANLQAHRKRATEWMLTDAHEMAKRFTTLTSKEAEIHILVDALRRGDDFEDYEITQIVQELLRIASTFESLQQLVVAMPASLGGLAPLAGKLFHPSLVVRMTVLALLRKIEKQLGGNGKLCFAKLNGFFLNAFEMLAGEYPDTSAAY